MKAIKKLMLITALMLVALVGSVFAAPINVQNVNVEKTSDGYAVLVTLFNDDVTSGVYDDLTFTIEELGISKSVGPITVGNETKILSYKLSEIVGDLSKLKKGNSYIITASTSTSSANSTFVYGTVPSETEKDILVENVRVNGESISDSDVLTVMNGETLNVELRIDALTNFDNARITAFIEGYEHSPLLGSTEIFSLKQGKTYVKNIRVTLPADMENQKEYKLRIVGANDLSGLLTKEYTIYVDTDRHRVDIIDTVMTPSSGVEPGQNLIANVRLKNRGQKSEESVKVIVSIPKLNVEESSYVSNLNPNEVITSDDMLLFVPENVTPGNYDVEVKLAYNDGYTTSVKKFNLNVLAPKKVEEKNLLVSFENDVELKEGEAKEFDIVIANPNKESKPISIVSLGNSWADVEVSPSLAMIKGGESASYHIKVTPKEGVYGDKELTLIIKKGVETLNEIKVKTYVEKRSSINWVNLALAVLLIIAIIILITMIVKVSKNRKEEDEEEVKKFVESEEGYY